MEVILKIIELLFSGLSSNQKFSIELAIILGIVIYFCVAMLTKTTIKFLGIEMKSNKKEDNDV